ncbi:MAG: ABC transporter ATP-binding protein [Clostridia bacterium]|nr:ABC transporter ATP-binding protein [Clostridia bacterium]
MLKRLSKCIKGYGKETFFSPFFIALEVIIECIIPYVTAELVNYLKNAPVLEMATIAKYGILLVVLAIASLSCGVLSGWFCATASCGFAKNLRHDLYYKVQDYSFANIDKFSTSSLVTRLTTDVTNVQQAFMMLIRIAIRAPFMLIFALVMAFIMGGALACIYVALVPVLGLALFFIARKVMPIFKGAFRKYDTLNESVQENIEGIRVVKSFVREDFETEKFKKASGDLAKDFERAEKILALNNPFMQIAINTSMVCVCLFASHLIISTGGKAFDIGNYSGLLTYGIQILSNCMMLSMVFVTMTMSMESARRIVEVLDEESTIKNPENPVMTVENGDITFENVSFKYSEKAEKNALSDINLRIRSGETIGIIGGTGSSKSSLIQMISRLYDATEGTVKVGGVDVRDYDLETLRNEVAVVLQKNVLFSGTIKENLRWGDPNASDEELVRVCKLACADEFVSQFPNGYDTYIERGGTNVSGGQKQRLCIARALLKKPKILILDDSTSAVDTKTDAMIRRAFREEIPGTTKIIIAQRISSVEDADRIIVLEGGRIDGIGSHAELLGTNAIYREVYESQVKGGSEE